MKGKVLTLIIGILIGAIITTAGFMLLNKRNANRMNFPRGQMTNSGEMPEGGPMNKVDRQNIEMPSKSSGDTTSNTTKES
ncbi:MAG: hypothetical protein J6A36_03495 [Clostridia bacterium]|nr:hypothetical protein [Clostridia bacterium]